MLHFQYLVIKAREMVKTESFLQDFFACSFPTASGPAVSEETGAKFFLEEIKGELEYSPWDHAAFICPDIEEVRKVLHERYPRLEAGAVAVAPSGRKHFFFKGPGGETWQILEDQRAKGFLTFDHLGLKVSSLSNSLNFYLKRLNFCLVEDFYFPGSNPPLAFVSLYDGFKIELIASDLPSRSQGIFQYIALRKNETKTSEGNFNSKANFLLGPNGERIGVN